MNRLDCAVSKDDSQSHGHLAVVKVNDLRNTVVVHFFSGGKSSDVAQILIIDFDHVLSFVQTEI